MQSFEQPHIVSFDHLEGSVAVAHTAFDHGALRRTNREVYQSAIRTGWLKGDAKRSCFAWERRPACRLIAVEHKSRSVLHLFSFLCVRFAVEVEL